MANIVLGALNNSKTKKPGVLNGLIAWPRKTRQPQNRGYSRLAIYCKRQEKQKFLIGDLAFGFATPINLLTANP